MKKLEKPPIELIKDSMKKDLNSPLTLNNFSFKKTFIGEWKNLFVFAILMFLAWGYFYDTTQCRELIENKQEVCMQYCSLDLLNQNPNQQLNFNIIDYGDSRENNQSNFPNSIPPNS